MTNEAEAVLPKLTIPLHLVDIPGAPEGWDWRPMWQHDICQRIVDSNKKIVILQAEPGSGKTTMAWAIAQLMGGQSLIMVRTRQLERQYLRDFDQLKMMEGRRNFICNLTHAPADRAPCTTGYKCALAGAYDPVQRRFVQQPDCHYFKAKSTAIDAKISIHNYSYWLGETKALAGISGFESPNLIVCDEAHELERILMDHETVELDPRVMRAAGTGILPRDGDVLVLKRWAVQVLPFVRARYEQLIAELNGDMMPGDLDHPIERDAPTNVEGVEADENGDLEGWMNVAKLGDARSLSNALDPLTNLASISDKELLEEWVLDTEDKTNHVIKVRPIYGRRGVTKLVNAAKTKIVFMSAYLAPELFIETLALNPDDCEIIEADEVYDRRKSPIVYMPVAKFNYDTPPYMWDRVVKIVDAIIEAQGTKGMIHVPSVALRDRILRGSAHKARMITYDGEYHAQRREGALTKDEAIEVFKASEGQTILLGQSISTGVDIPYVPLWQVIVKMPFPPPIDPAMKARMARDKAFYVYLTICDLVQAAGRIKRAPDHDGPTIILDMNFGWFHAANRAYFPAWFENVLRDDKAIKADVKFRQACLRKGLVL